MKKSPKNEWVAAYQGTRLGYFFATEHEAALYNKINISIGMNIEIRRFCYFDNRRYEPKKSATG